MGGARRVEVALPVPIFRTFTYSLPAELALRPGARVLVPFRRGVRIGWLLGPDQREPAARVRSVLDVLDDEPSLSAPVYRDTFGNDSMFLTMIELDWQFWHPPGVSLGVGGAVGFMQAWAKAQLEEAPEGEETDSADYTVLNVIPFSLLAVVRVDALADYLNVPLVPYFKIGLNWYVWWVLGGDGTELVEGNKASGGTMGWQAQVGLMIRLDQFDPMSARTFDNEVGVNHSYIFAELLWADVDNFGNSDVLHLGTDNFFKATVLAGIALEF